MWRCSGDDDADAMLELVHQRRRWWRRRSNCASSAAWRCHNDGEREALQGMPRVERRETRREETRLTVTRRTRGGCGCDCTSAGAHAVRLHGVLSTRSGGGFAAQERFEPESWWSYSVYRANAPSARHTRTPCRRPRSGSRTPRAHGQRITPNTASCHTATRCRTAAAAEPRCPPACAASASSSARSTSRRHSRADCDRRRRTASAPSARRAPRPRRPRTYSARPSAASLHGAAWNRSYRPPSITTRRSLSACGAATSASPAQHAPRTYVARSLSQSPSMPSS